MGILRRIARGFGFFIGLVAIAVAIWGLLRITADTRGRLQARWDMAHGHYGLKTYGLTASFRPEYSRLLKERYGVMVPVFSRCMVTDGEVVYKNAYNETVKSAVIAKFGKDVFAECRADAESLLREKNSNYRP